MMQVLAVAAHVVHPYAITAGIQICLVVRETIMLCLLHSGQKGAHTAISCSSGERP